jgi:aspartate racemase
MHKTIGILGGLSPESTVAYYRRITRRYTERFGDYGYPPIVVYSVSFQPYVDWSEQGRWDLAAAGLTEAARKLEAAGADFVLLATNTMHLVFDQVAGGVGIPCLSLVDAVADAIERRGLTSVGLLGTTFTMEQPLYQPALARRGVSVLLPDPGDRAYVNDVIYRELVAGEIRDRSRAGYARIIKGLAAAGAQAVILGCTEIPLLIAERDVGVPLFDSTAIHAEAALDYAVS